MDVRHHMSYLTHFSEHQWLLVGKYTLLLGLGYFQKLGLNIFQMCLKTPENLLDLSAEENKETSVEHLEIKTEIFKTLSCEAHVLQNYKAIPQIILNKKNLQCNILPIEQGDQFVYQSYVIGDSKRNLTDYKMYIIFRRFFLQFPKKTWAHFIKIFFVFGIHSISHVNIKLHTLSLDILRDLVNDYDAVLETKQWRSSIKTQGNSCSIIKNSQGILQGNSRGTQPQKIYRRVLVKSREPDLNHEQLVFPFQFIVSAFFEEKKSLNTVYPNWWSDEECVSYKKNKIKSFLNRLTTIKAQQAVQFMKKQQRFNHCEKNENKTPAASTSCIKNSSIKKQENINFQNSNKKNRNGDKCPKASFFLTQSLHVYSLNPFLTQKCNVKDKSTAEIHSKHLMNIEKTLKTPVCNVNNNTLPYIIKEKSMTNNKLMCNSKKNSFSTCVSTLTDRATKPEFHSLSKMSKTMVSQNFKKISQSLKSLEIQKTSSKPTLERKPSSYVYETQTNHPLEVLSEETFLYSRPTTRINGRINARHVCISNRREQVLELEDTETQKITSLKPKVLQGARQQFEKRPCFRRVSYNAHQSTTLPLHLLCHSYQR